MVISKVKNNNKQKQFASSRKIKKWNKEQINLKKNYGCLKKIRKTWKKLKIEKQTGNLKDYYGKLYEN